jgi:hypothetical protein
MTCVHAAGVPQKHTYSHAILQSHLSFFSFASCKVHELFSQVASLADCAFLVFWSTKCVLKLWPAEQGQHKISHEHM